MKDSFEDAKKAARRRMQAEADSAKASFIRDVKKGLGEEMKKELENPKVPSKWSLLWNKIKIVLNL